MLPTPNVRQAVPFFGVANMERSLAFNCNGLGFTLKNSWNPQGRIRGCWLDRGEASVMLQAYLEGKRPEGTPGLGMSICFMCEDAVAMYRETQARGL